ncbi:uncharacterized protein LOC9650684 [Selaginella moellendorffii]|nr:uncharacterized protein LOC9650684 [Selaginella moellendorffii]|eukprot:XP_024521592.1 uncharacterized protein LOC9650684 [Selaginella moellendorffii]
MGVSFIPADEVMEPVVASPGFEGFEKRLEVEFWDPLGFADPSGLRAIPRNEIDTMLSAAECTIVSALSNSHFDSYVLSESSLFVYPSKIVIKTCGTTQLLKAIPLLLKSASFISLEACRCKYSRGTFIFPSAQPSPYGNFNEEVVILEKYFGHLGNGGKACVMSDASKMHNWHVYVAASEVAPLSSETYTMEMCMTQLDRSSAALFYKSPFYRSAADMTLLSGIRNLLPHSEICDFAFDPCGYSMNSVEGNAHSTIHITPEDGFSYASFETMGYSPCMLDLGSLVDRVLGCFKPAVFSISLSTAGLCHSRDAGSWGVPVCPRGYVCSGTTRHEMPGGSFVVYHTYTRILGGDSTVMPLALFPALEKVASNGYKSKNSEASLKPFLYGVQPLRESGGAEVIGPTARDMDSFIRKKIQSTGREDAFYVLDLATVTRLWKIWKSAMPRVNPFYAVKCNPDPQLLSMLAALGAGFDVASKAELEAVTQLGVAPRNIIFANPCKLPSHITEAAKAGVVYTTFDSEGELYKLKKYHPQAEVLLRFRSDDTGARCPLGVKYGAEWDECYHLLEVAKTLGIKVAGVAFHVGSGASDVNAFAEGIKAARKLFDMAESLGLPRMTMLDIGGGFVSDGGAGVKFAAAAYEIGNALEEHFPLETMADVRIIGEPGRFFAEEAFSLAALVFGCRVRRREEGNKTVVEYWINDGIYGSMNCLLYDHATLSVRALPVASSGGGSSSGSDCESSSEDEEDDAPLLDVELHPSIIFGPTCDGLDTVLSDVWLPRLQCGDWLVFPRMGAYTKSAGSSFNGFAVPDATFYVHCGAAPEM